MVHVVQTEKIRVHVAQTEMILAASVDVDQKSVSEVVCLLLLFWCIYTTSVIEHL